MTAFATIEAKWPGAWHRDLCTGTIRYERAVLVPDSWMLYDIRGREYRPSARYDYGAEAAVLALLRQASAAISAKPTYSHRYLVMATVGVPDTAGDGLYQLVADADRSAIAALAAYSAAIDTPLPWCWRAEAKAWKEVKL